MRQVVHVAPGDTVEIIADGTSTPPSSGGGSGDGGGSGSGDGGGSGGGSVPVGGTRLTWPWDGPQPPRLTSGPIDSNTPVITEFTTGANLTPAANMLSAIEAGDYGASVARVGCLSRTAGDFSGLDLGYGSLSGPSPNVTVSFAIGLSVPYAVRLEPNTRYFWNVKAAQPGDAAADCFVHVRKVGGV